MIRRLEKVLISIGLLDSSLEKWERTAGIWMSGTLAIRILPLAAVVFDDLLLDRRFNSSPRPIGLVILLSFFAGAGYWVIMGVALVPRWYRERSGVQLHLRQ